MGGAGRGSFNHRFAQASRDAEQFFNVFYPADMFPFTDGPETDPETGQTDSLLGRAEARHIAPKAGRFIRINWRCAFYSELESAWVGHINGELSAHFGYSISAARNAAPKKRGSW